MATSTTTPANTVTNWFGNVVSHPAVIVDAHSVDDIIAVLKNPAKYPAPVRAVGSNHSTAPCGTADGGTLIRMKMNQILNINPGGNPPTITAQADCTHLQMAKALQAQKLQFYVNTEIGSLSAGSASCAGTKDASFPGEYGQVGSYVIGVKMVLPSGELLEVTEAENPALMQLVRSSYGLFGVIYEVTYQVKALTPMHVHHTTYSLADFLKALPDFQALGYSIMYYMFPFVDKITVEFRKYNPTATGDPAHFPWVLRNQLWGTTGPKAGHDIEQNFSVPAIRYGIIDSFNAFWRSQLENVVVGDNTLPADQIIDYPPVSNDSRYTFSLFAFPEAEFPAAITDFYKFCNDYYKQKGYRSNLLYVGYRIAQDQKALLSYSWDGPVLTLDPVSTANPGWEDFLVAYNQWCSDRNGLPLLNQTPDLTPAILQKAYGSRLTQLNEARKQYDPGDRLLNDYFRVLLSI
ncbi:FAD-dependent oxidoreductase [Acidicapsa dinghuensis]|uniref:FAD-dependent oxidoreductase n=1 Tax=Acidicapsa dinghuensis TaxID=2218256 RepID=A0ABW1EJH6_9BACT|nr:FAD-dependent oxidoreductase [Acidicapsa dinghuensis]